ncbi:MAG: NlpC/P60 family protein [Clostridiales bacterium]|nr:NlpC/P60 family protein [Clostridiales bacterium]MCI1960698.1 NlpC/P60 family protein [Clostridiales bacterium]MCI2021139.1 NlpC/P60 family protein [Clostridiales bacterium]MCI2025522.1 NlpC/P60 family protein [Clostridiales bacterium]
MKLKRSAALRILTVVLAFSVVTANMALPAVHAEDSASLQAQQSELSNQQKENDDQLSTLRQNKDEKTAYAAALQSQLATIEDEVNNYNNQISDLDLQAQQVQDDIDKMQAQIDDDTNQLKERLCALYMGRDACNLQILLSSKDLLDLADKTEAVTMVTQHDTDLIDRLKSEKQEVQDKKQVIDQKRQEVAALKDSVDQKQQQLTSSLEETTQFLQDIGQQETDLESKSSSLDAQAAKISAALNSWSGQQASVSASPAAQTTPATQTTTATAASGNSGSNNSGSYSGDSSTGGSSGSSGGSSASFSSVIAKAESALGKPYVMGAAGPDAFDCSGLICWAYGVSRTTAQGLCNECSRISVSERQPGDLIFFQGTYNCGETVTHVGIYIGSNMMIDAEDGGVSECSTESSYNLQHFYCYGRL